ncbi:MAG: hypothetical protein R3321_00030 [Nitrososphaeraceae archaeon]|nr:hypothetical protein [Nitrososphaeraceae archaeon]
MNYNQFYDVHWSFFLVKHSDNIHKFAPSQFFSEDVWNTWTKEDQLKWFKIECEKTIKNKLTRLIHKIKVTQ